MFLTFTSEYPQFTWQVFSILILELSIFVCWLLFWNYCVKCNNKADKEFFNDFEMEKKHQSEILNIKPEVSKLVELA